MIRDEGAGSLTRGMAPNVVRAILMNASQLASYDWFKAELLRSGFKDGIGCHFIASFAAVSKISDPVSVSTSNLLVANPLLGNRRDESVIYPFLTTESCTHVLASQLCVPQPMSSR